MPKLTSRSTSNNPRPKRRGWSASAGGNRITRITAVLIGEQNLVNHLPADSPRRTPTLSKLKFLTVEETST